MARNKYGLGMGYNDITVDTNLWTGSKTKTVLNFFQKKLNICSATNHPPCSHLQQKLGSQFQVWKSLSLDNIYVFDKESTATFPQCYQVILAYCKKKANHKHYITIDM